MFMKIGAQIVLITNPRDIRAFIDEIKNINFTAIIGVNTLYHALLNAPGFLRSRPAPLNSSWPAAWLSNGRC